MPADEMTDGHVELHRLAVPEWLAGKTLAESRIASRTGLNAVAIREEDGSVVPARSSAPLRSGAELLAVGSEEQLTAFLEEPEGLVA